MQEPVALQGVFARATTLADGGWRCAFDCPEQMADKVAELSKLRGEALFFVVMTEQQYLESRNG